MICKIDKEDLVLFGAGLTGSGAVNYFDQQIVAVIDNDPTKQGKIWNGINVISLDNYKKDYANLSIVLSIYSKRYFEVRRQLEDNKITNYFTIPPVVYGYPKPEEFAQKIIDRHYKKVFFDHDNPISRRMIRFLSQLDIECFIGIDKCCIAPFIKDSESVVVYTANEIEGYLRKQYKGKIKSAILDIYEELRKKEELKKYKNIHEGESCFIIGNGPSLRADDLEKLRKNNVICFASNGIYNIYSQTNWRPNYYTIIDILALTRFQEGILAMEAENCFLADCSYVEGYRGKGVNLFTVKNYLSQNSEFEFSDDISKYIVSGKTVTYAMFQIACFMGFKIIYLLGVDWTGGKGTNKKRFDFYDKGKPSVDIGMFDLIEEERNAYLSAQKYAESKGIKIYNATRGGELEVFKRIEFDSLMEEMEK